MSDTYTGICRMCKKETDLIEGICEECNLTADKIVKASTEDLHGNFGMQDEFFNN